MTKLLNVNKLVVLNLLDGRVDITEPDTLVGDIEGERERLPDPNDETFKCKQIGCPKFT